MALEEQSEVDNLVSEAESEAKEEAEPEEEAESEAKEEAESEAKEEATVVVKEVLRSKKQKKPGRFAKVSRREKKKLSTIERYEYPVRSPIASDDVVKTVVDTFVKGIEVEVSIGKFVRNKNAETFRFVPGVTREQLTNMFLYIHSKPELYTIGQIDVTNEFRKDTFRIIKRSDSVSYEEKVRIETINIEEWDMRINVSKETTLDETPFEESQYDVYRIKSRRRIRFVSSGGIVSMSPNFVIDITQVEEHAQTRATVIRYEVEIEYVGAASITKQDILEMTEAGREIRALCETIDIDLVIGRTERIEAALVFNKLYSRDLALINRSVDGDLYDQYNKPRNIKPKDMLQFEFDKYAITDKLDGERRFLLVTQKGTYMIALPKAGKLSNIVKIGDTIEGMEGTLVDGEYYVTDQTRYYFAFDVMFIAGMDVRKYLFTERIKHASKIREVPRALYRVSDKQSVSVPFITYEVKKFFIEPVKELHEDFYYMIKRAYTYTKDRESDGFRTDGLIFQPIISEDDDIVFYKNVNTLKWKPLDKITIDFKVVPSKTKKDTFILMVSGKEGKKIPFSKAEPIVIKDGMFEGVPIANKVVEFGWDQMKKTFVAQRIRYDKTENDEPNFVKVANDVWEDILKPVTLNVLLGSTIRVLRVYHNREKELMLRTSFKPGDKIVDIGSGRGGDLRKWRDLGLSVLGVDPNEENVSEFNKRKSEMKEVTEISALLAKAQDTNKIERALNYKTVRGVTSFFSLTFFAETEKILDGLLMTVDSVLADGGLFIGIYMEGTKVKKMFAETGTRTIENDAFSIKLDDISSERVFGNSIITSLIDEGAMVKDQKEYLLDYNVLVEKMRARGFEEIEPASLSMSEYLDEVKFLPKDSLSLSSLNRRFIFKKPSREKKERLVDVYKPIEERLVEIPKAVEVVKLVPVKLNKSVQFKSPLNINSDLYRMYGVPGTSSLLHAMLLSINDRSYKTALDREIHVVQIRKCMAVALKTDVAYEELRNVMVASRDELQQYATKFESSEAIDDAMIVFISDMYDVDIYVLDSDTMYIRKIGNYALRFKRRKSIVLLRLKDRYEIIARKANGKYIKIFSGGETIIDPVTTRLIMTKPDEMITELYLKARGSA